MSAADNSITLVDVTMGMSTARPRDSTFFPSPSSKKVLCDSTVSPHCVTPARGNKIPRCAAVDQCTDFMSENPSWHNQKNPILFTPRICGLVLSGDDTQLSMQLLGHCVTRLLTSDRPFQSNGLPVLQSTGRDPYT